jgi:hypothetical protein
MVCVLGGGEGIVSVSVVVEMGVVVRIWMEPVVVIVDVVVLVGVGMLRQEQAFEIMDGLLEGR